MNISFCPYRTNIDWSTIQTTHFTQPVTFTGTPRDLQLLDACKEREEAEEFSDTLEVSSDEVLPEVLPTEAGEFTHFNVPVAVVCHHIYHYIQ